MQEALTTLIRSQPELAIFGTIVLGHLVGRTGWRGVSLGSVVGTLIAGMLIGIWSRPEIPNLLKWAFFDLFLFSLGYAAGPQFFSSLRRGSLPQLVLAMVVATAGLGTAMLMTTLCRFDPGLAGGLLSGALTQSAALGSALGTLQTLPASAAEIELWAAHAPLADATTYIFGEIGLILLVTVLAPRLLGQDLRTLALQAEVALSARQDGDGDGENSFLAYTPVTYRAYRIDTAHAGLQVSQLESRFTQGRMVVQAIRRNGEIIRRVERDALLQHGDVVALASRRPGMVAAAAELGEEIDDRELLALPMRDVSVVLTHPKLSGLTLAELGERYGRGIFLRRVTRGQQQLPHAPRTVVQRGDVLHLTGSVDLLNEQTRLIGFAEPDPSRTDLVFLAGGIVLGTLLGLIQLNWASVPLGLGGSGGVLVVGLIAGWAHSRYPVVGRIPESAQRLLSDVGLIVFIAAVGLSAGPHAIEAVDQGGVALFGKLLLAGAAVTLAGPLLGLLVGHKLLKMPAALLLPGIAGAQTTIATINALKERTGSDVFAIGFTVPFAISNILITMWGPIIVSYAYQIGKA